MANKEMTKKELTKLLNYLGACSASKLWLKKQKVQTAKEAWARLPDFDWGIWLLEKTGGLNNKIGSLWDRHDDTLSRILSHSDASYQKAHYLWADNKITLKERNRRQSLAYKTEQNADKEAKAKFCALLVKKANWKAMEKAMFKILEEGWDYGNQ